MEGEALDVDRLFYTPEGKPRVSILSIAHLGDRERMFFVSLLLNELLGWMRSQPGTTSLRALFYMDEVFGYFPPVANPPTKAPLLTLLKQGRAFGLGALLATQNPGGPGLQGPVERRHLVPRPSADRARQGAGARRPRRRHHVGRRVVRPVADRPDPQRAEHARVPDEQRARRRADRVRDALGDVLPARPADPRTDQDADVAAQGRGRSRAAVATGRSRVGRRPRRPPTRRPVRTRSRTARCCLPRSRSSSCPAAAPLAAGAELVYVPHGDWHREPCCSPRRSWA